MKYLIRKIDKSEMKVPDVTTMFYTDMTCPVCGKPLVGCKDYVYCLDCDYAGIYE